MSEHLLNSYLVVLTQKEAKMKENENDIYSKKVGFTLSISE